MLPSDTKWKILKLLSKGDKTPTEIAKLLKISIQSTQSHLSRLEKEGSIKKTEGKKGKTRPFTQYSIGDGFVYFVEVLPGDAEKRFLKIDDELKLHLRIWSIPQQEFHGYIEQYFRLIKDNYPEKLESLAVFGSVARGNAKPDSDIDILILVKGTKEEAKRSARGFENVRTEFENVMVGSGNTRKGVMAQIFSPEDFRDSLEKGSIFLREIIKDMKIIYDKNKLLESITA